MFNLFTLLKMSIHSSLSYVVCTGAVLALLFLGGGDAAPLSSSCPTVTVQPDFNLTKFVSHKWYIHMQMPIKYLPENEMYCVVATYTQKDAKNVKVHNYANINHTNGPVDDSDVHVKSLGGICGKVQDTDQPAKLAVGPCKLGILSRFVYGPYWVLATGGNDCVGDACATPSGDYEWALISGGQPTHQAPGGCRTGTGVNKSGLWIFQKSPVRNSTLIEEVKNIAKAKGFDVSVLRDVQQAGCKYLPPKAEANLS